MSIPDYVPNSTPKDYREQSPETQDIIFLIEDKTLGETKQLGAHKFVLALNSDVMKAELYGTLRESSGEIRIVDSSFKGFQIFLDALYGRQPCWTELNIDELLEINYLATKYLISKLCEVVLKAIQEHEVKKENIKDIFQCAENNSHLGKIAEELNKKCNDFYASLSASDITDMMCHYGNNMEDVNLLIKMMAGFKLQSSKQKFSCKYCPCPGGKHIEQLPKEEQATYLRKGMRVVRGDDWQSAHGNQDGNGPGTVMESDSLGAVYIRVKWDNGRTGYYLMGKLGIFEIKLA